MGFYKSTNGIMCNPSPDSEITVPLPVVSAINIYSFEMMLLAIGNRSAALAMARMPWQPVNISLKQSNYALGLALRYAGGAFNVPCTSSVPFLVLPHLVLSTVVGAVYPPDFALGVETLLPTMQDMQDRRIVSAVASFVSAQGARTGQAPVELTGLALAAGRRDEACGNQTEWRFHRLGRADGAACACDANRLCAGETVCASGVNGSDRWAIAALDPAQCRPPDAAAGGPDLAFMLGIGLGLGLGPMLLLSTMIWFLFCGKKEERKRITRLDIVNSRVAPIKDPAAV